jgi:hypothetical protein
MSFIGRSGCRGQRRILVHATSHANADKIILSGEMILGRRGLFGPGIYFAETEESAKHKCIGDGTAAESLITADVEVGIQLKIEGEADYLNSDIIQNKCCDSVLGKSWKGAKEEFVVYDSNKVKVNNRQLLKPHGTKININVRYGDSSSNLISLYSSQYVLELKNEIRNRKGANYSVDQILYNGRRMNDNQTLQSCGMNKNIATAFCMGRLVGG